VSEPIWFTLIKIALAARSRMPRSRRSVFVTNRSSPTSWTRPPSSRVSVVHPSQSSSASASSIDTIGNRSSSAVQ
jgi:hypothetical protein